MDDIVEQSDEIRPRRVTKRGAETRVRIIDAAVQVIVREGYGAATIERILGEAAVSRGSLLHQFPNRIALMVATAEWAMETMMTSSKAASARIPDAFQRLVDHSHITWMVHNQPSGLTVMDILLAARWDRDLAHALQPVALRIEQDIQRGLWELASDAGLPDPSAYISQGWVIVAATRGLISEMSIGIDRPMILAAVAQMHEQHRLFCLDLVNGTPLIGR